MRIDIVCVLVSGLYFVFFIICMYMLSGYVFVVCYNGPFICT